MSQMKTKALNVTWDNDFEKGLDKTLKWSKEFLKKCIKMVNCSSNQHSMMVLF